MTPEKLDYLIANLPEVEGTAGEYVCMHNRLWVGSDEDGNVSPDMVAFAKAEGFKVVYDAGLYEFVEV